MVSFPQVSLPEPWAHLSLPIRATCSAHLILLDFTTRTILGKECRSLSGRTELNWYNYYFYYKGIADTRSVCSSFSELASIIYTNSCMREEMYIRMRSEGSFPKNGEPKLVSSSQCSSTPVGFGQGQHDNTAASPILFWLGWGWILLVPSIEISRRHSCYSTDIKNATEELKRPSQNGF
jgi:hypothetical protein